MEKEAKSVARSFILMTTAIGIMLPLIALYTYDPLMIFHKPWFREITLHHDMRRQAAGIINNLEFDSVILGTSMLENTSGEEADRGLGGTFVNISIEGSDFFERAIVLEHLFREKSNVRKVIFSLDSFSEGLGDENYPVDRFDFLYDECFFNDFKAYTDKKFLKCVLTFSDSIGCVGRELSPKMPNPWYLAKANAGRFGGIQNWFPGEINSKPDKVLEHILISADKIKKGEIKSPLENKIDSSIESAKLYLDNYVLRFVRAHNDTDFHLVLPPYSRIRYAQWYQLNQVYMYVHEAMIRYLADEAAKLPNLYVYGFEDQNFPDDIANYKDTFHFNKEINSMILISMRDKKHLIVSETVESYLETAREKAFAFDLVGFSSVIESYLKYDNSLIEN